METTTSQDDTRIAFERLGEGPALLVVGGATCDRAKMRPISAALAAEFTVINFDRRGRGDSGHSAHYAVEREIEDLAALLTAAGGAAAIYGHSSGAALALRAAAAGLPITRVVAHEAPYSPPDSVEQDHARAYGRNVRDLIKAGDGGGAIARFMMHTGMPAPMIEAMRGDPSWPAMARIAPTLAYDSEVMEDLETGALVPVDQLARIDAPALALYGTVSPPMMKAAALQIAASVKHGGVLDLEGQHHVVPPEVLVSAVGPFLAG